MDIVDTSARGHLPEWPPCPHLPSPSDPLDHTIMRPYRRERGAAFYETALTYANSLWLQGLPARSLLLINRALGATLDGSEPILRTWPLPYAAVRWILENRPDETKHFIGNPRRHYQHLATRMVEPRKAQRTARAWACWYLAATILPADQHPADTQQIRDEGVIEPSREQIAQALEQHGLSGESTLWEEVVLSHKR